MHKIAQKNWSEEIFRAYDIRGKYPEEINEDAAYKIARAFVRYLKLSLPDGGKVKILLSSDARPSSPALKDAFLEGLLDEGADVVDAGFTTTPMHYFAVNVSEADGGAMITASHLAAVFNGIKLSRKSAIPIGGAPVGGMEEIKNDALRGIFQNSGVRGNLEKKDFLGEYIEFFIKKFPDLKTQSLRIAACAGNGMTTILLKKLFEKFGKFEVTFLHDTLDMTFPNHEANPLKAENLEDIRDEVLKKRASLGVSFDGDGDRIGFVDENGNILSGDIVAALLVRHFGFSGGGAIVYDVRSSGVIREEIENLGMKPVESRVGHAFIKQLMRREGAVFGGELSGHYYFKDFFFCDSAIFAMLSILDLIRITKTPLSELARPLMRYYKSEEINFEVVLKDKVLDKMAEYFRDAKISYLDGIKVEYPNWWFNLRLSNTENLVRLNIEANSPELLEEKKKLLESLIG